MPRWLAMVMLVVSPVTLTAAIVVTVAFAVSLRKSWHAVRVLRPEGLLVAIGVWVVHLGFVLAPVLYAGDRRGLAMWLTIPVTVIATVLLTVFVLTERERPRGVASSVPEVIVNVTVVSGAVVYWLPLAALAFGK